MPAAIAPSIKIRELFLPDIINAKIIPGSDACPTASPIRLCPFKILIVPTIPVAMASSIVPIATTINEYCVIILIFIAYSPYVASIFSFTKTSSVLPLAISCLLTIIT